MDAHLVDAARAGRVHFRELDRADLRDLVGALTARGESTTLIAERIGCGERLVRTLRHEHRAQDQG